MLSNYKSVTVMNPTHGSEVISISIFNTTYIVNTHPSPVSPSYSPIPVPMYEDFPEVITIIFYNVQVFFGLWSGLPNLRTNFRKPSTFNIFSKRIVWVKITHD